MSYQKDKTEVSHLEKKLRGNLITLLFWHRPWIPCTQVTCVAILITKGSRFKVSLKLRKGNVFSRVWLFTRVVPCGHYPGCIGPHLTGPPTPPSPAKHWPALSHNMDTNRQRPQPYRDYAASDIWWRRLKTCSNMFTCWLPLPDLTSGGYWRKSTYGQLKRPVRMLLECLLVSNKKRSLLCYRRTHLSDRQVADRIFGRESLYNVVMTVSGEESFLLEIFINTQSSLIGVFFRNKQSWQCRN